MPNFQTILYTVDQHVAIIKLNRPERRNALTEELLKELRIAFDSAASDADVRTVLLTGEGKGFCAGQDLGQFDGASSPESVRNSVMNFYKPVIMAMTTIEKPVIGAINGAAAGAGASIALACDLRIMADDAFIMQAFSNIGLVPDAGSNWFMTRLLGYSRAYQLVIEAERISAERCLELGLTNLVTTSEALQDDALDWARQLSQRPTYALGQTKKLMMQAYSASLEETIALEAEAQAQAVQSFDHTEGVTAFMEKRKPAFQGR